MVIMSQSPDVFAVMPDADMPAGLAPRLVAVHLLADVLDRRLPLEDRLGGGAMPAPRAGFAPLPSLSLRDQALARSIVVVSLRRLGTLRAALAQCLDKGLPRGVPALEWILVTAAAQILYLDIPDHAAVDMAVHAVKRHRHLKNFASLTNAVLRRIVRQRQKVSDSADPFIDTPAWLAQRWQSTYGVERAAAIARAHQNEPTLDIGVRSDPAHWAHVLGGLVLPTGSVRLLGHDHIETLDGYAEGAWWVQDAAAALPARLLKIGAGDVVADLCAAPGGKTIQLALTGAHVIAFDRSAPRLRRLHANMERMKLKVDVRVADVLKADIEPCDAILLDAPCSSTGTIRRHPDVAWIKSVDDITHLAQVQSALLDRAIDALKSSGQLVYCTCSLEPEEGEHQIAACLSRRSDVMRDPIRADEIGGCVDMLTPLGEVRSLPSLWWGDDARKAGIDGFFAARLRRC
jgi:16S rRNA (cytosine967-C5)-methyltransferase